MGHPIRWSIVLCQQDGDKSLANIQPLFGLITPTPSIFLFAQVHKTTAAQHKKQNKTKLIFPKPHPTNTKEKNNP